LKAPNGVSVNWFFFFKQKTAYEMDVFDYSNIPNGLFHSAPPVPAKCSFDISWSGQAGVAGRLPVTAPSGSAGELISGDTVDLTCEATMQWSASTESGFHFETDPNAPTTSWF